MTIQQIRAEVQSRVNDSSLTTPSIDLWLNLAIQDISRRADWPWNTDTKATDTTTNGTAEISLPSGYARMGSVRVGVASTTTEPNSTEYTYVDYDAKNVSTDGNYYYINQTTGKYGLIPTPTTTGLPVYLRFQSVESDISDSNTTIPIPVPYHEVLIFAACKKYWETADDFGKVLFYNAEYENMVERMKSDLLSPSRGKLPRVRDIRELVGISHPQAPNSVSLGI